MNPNPAESDDSLSEFEFSEEPVDLSQYPPSPVPSDEYLWPGEKPFTAFGQYGDDALDLRVFEQDVYWVDRKGEPHLIVEMSDAYRANVIGFLRDHERFYYTLTLMRSITTMLGETALGRVPAEVLLEDLGVPTLPDLEPDEWLESTPLMRALQRLTPTPRPPVEPTE